MYGRSAKLKERAHLLEVRKEFSVDETACSVVERRVDGDDIALGDKVLEVFDAASTDGFGSSCRTRSVLI